MVFIADRYEIVLNFHYLPILHIATVEVKLSIKDANVTDRVRFVRGLRL